MLVNSSCNKRSVAVAVSLVLTLLSSCGGGGGSGTLEEISGLKVSLTDYRYGVQDLGSRTEQKFELKNVGVDSYPINSVAITGENPEDFIADLPAGLTLEPGDKIELRVAFSPVSGGQRTASLDIDYDTVVGNGSNRTEALYYSALANEQNGDYMAAVDQYKQYLNSNATTENKARAMIKLPLLEEADVYGAAGDFGLYLTALDKRDEGDFQSSLVLVETLIRQHGDSYLVDDAKYLRAYVKMVDLGEYQNAYNDFQVLIDQHPDSSYADTALYSQGLAQHELGNLEEAEEIFLALKDRHTGVKLDLFEMQWPKDNYISRLWFDKTEEQLEQIEDVSDTTTETINGTDQAPAESEPTDQSVDQDQTE